ncbi:MAG TPA: nucleoside recognition domain-containing protein [Symbiobacteriaceae bacterium]|nr:nucleoside recognition domain-containing protein [Symbiobacteriaceae bacterium]
MLQWIWSGFLDGLSKLLTLWWVPLLLIALQILKDSGYLMKLNRLAKPLLRYLRLPDEAGFPVVAAIGLGVTYGSGLIIQAAEESNFTQAQMTVMVIFVGICHAIFEETALFFGAGANGFLLLAIRFASAFVFGGLATLWFYRRPAERAVQKGA